jgi:hypothetical protein
MNVRRFVSIAAIVFATTTVVLAQTNQDSPQKRIMLTMQTAEGSFDVKVAPLAEDDATAGTAIARYSLDKQYHGDLEATAKGEMMGVGSPATGTAGYVAIEQVTGSLHGRKGGFALQHSSTMDAGKFEMNIQVAPGSGTGELTGIAGKLTITIAGGKHTYRLEYTLP